MKMSLYQKCELFKLELLKKQTVRELQIRKLFNSLNIPSHSQPIICPYIVDFYLPTKCLVIELDGGIHNASIQKERDYRKDDYILSLGIMIQRFKNSTPDEEIVKTIINYPLVSDQTISRTGEIISKVNKFYSSVDNSDMRANDYKELFKYAVTKINTHWVRSINRCKYTETRQKLIKQMFEKTGVHYDEIKHKYPAGFGLTPRQLKNIKEGKYIHPLSAEVSNA